MTSLPRRCANPQDPAVDALTDEERALLDHLLRSHHRWHPNKKADAWVSSACHLLRRSRELLAPEVPE